MKSHIVLFALLIAFEKRYANAQNVKWETDGKTFEAEFTQNNTEYSAEFAPDGSWLATEHHIEINLVPPAVLESIKKSYAGYEIEEVEAIESAKHGNIFEVELELEEDGKDQEKEVLFDSSGKEIAALSDL